MPLCTFYQAYIFAVVKKGREAATETPSIQPDLRSAIAY